MALTTTALPPRRTLRDGTDLLLRAHTAADADALVETSRDPEVQRWTRVPVPYDRGDALEFVQCTERGWRDGELASFAVEHDGRCAGSVALRPLDGGWADLGYRTAAWARGRGLTSRAVRLLLAWGFEELGLRGVRWSAVVGNWASRRVAWACGFRIEGVARGVCEQRGERLDGWTGSLLASEPLEPAAPWLDVPELDGDGVRLRPWREEDAGRIAEACTDPLTQRWLPNLPAPYTRADALEFVALGREAAAAGDAVHWCVADAEDRCVASVSVVLLPRGSGGEVGWWAHPQARGRGFVTRGARLAAAHAFAPVADGGLGLHRLLVRAAEDNTASRAVALRLGARESGRDREVEEFRDGHRGDHVRHDLLAREFRGA